MPIHIPPEAADAAPGMIASFVATAKYTTGTLFVRGAMWLGGASLSFFGADPTASALGITAKGGTGLVGFALGFFGMAIAAKGYEVITTFDAAGVGKDIKDAIRKKLGLGDQP